MDLTAVSLLLSAQSEEAAEAEWSDALPALGTMFDPDVWGASYSVNQYGAGAHGNLYNVEGQRDFKLCWSSTTCRSRTTRLRSARFSTSASSCTSFLSCRAREATRAGGFGRSAFPRSA